MRNHEFNSTTNETKETSVKCAVGSANKRVGKV